MYSVVYTPLGRPTVPRLSSTVTLSTMCNTVGQSFCHGDPDFSAANIAVVDVV